MFRLNKNLTWISRIRGLLCSFLCFFILLCASFFSVQAQDNLTPSYPSNWVFFLDTSGSMVGGKGKQGDIIIKGEDIFEEVRATLKEIVTKYPQKNSIVSLYSFNETTILQKQIKIETENDRQLFLHTIDNIPRPKSNETTCLSAAVKNGYQVALQLTKTNYFATNLVIITDGFDSPDKCQLLRLSGENLSGELFNNLQYFKLYKVNTDKPGQSKHSLPANLNEPTTQRPASSSPIRNKLATQLPNSTFPTVYKIIYQIPEAALKISLLSLAVHGLYLLFVKLSLKNSSQDVLGGLVAQMFNTWLDVAQNRATLFQYNLMLLIHVLPASIIAAVLWQYIYIPIFIVNLVLALLMLVFFKMRH